MEEVPWTPVPGDVFKAAALSKKQDRKTKEGENCVGMNRPS